MYLKKSSRPRTATLADGRVLSLADLPPPGTRWVASRKAAVIFAVQHGLLSRDDAVSRYQLTDEEFDGWIAAVNTHGIGALKVTATQKFRQPKVEP